MKQKFMRLGNGSKNVKMIHTQRLISSLYKGDYSIVELAKIIGVTHPTTKLIIDQLFMENYIVRSDIIPEKSKGRPHVRYTLNKNHGVFLCINLERYDSSYYIFDFKMNEVKRRKLKTINYDINDLETIVRDIKDDLKAIGLPLLYVSIAMVGEVNQKQEVVVSSLFDKNLKNFNFHDFFLKALKAPVIIENDTRVASIGEVKEGELDKISNLIYIQMGSGISSVVYNKGEQIIGDDLLAGEIGLTITETGDTLYHECALRSIVDKLEEHLPDQRIESLIAKMDTNPLVYNTVMNSAIILGKFLRNISYLTGIGNFALAGAINAMPDDYFKKIIEGTEIVYTYYPDSRNKYDLNIIRPNSKNPVKLGLKYLAKTNYISSLVKQF